MSRMHLGRHVSSVPLLWVSQRRRERNLYEDEEDIYLARLHY